MLSENLDLIRCLYSCWIDYFSVYASKQGTTMLLDSRVQLQSVCSHQCVCQSLGLDTLHAVLLDLQMYWVDGNSIQRAMQRRYSRYRCQRLCTPLLAPLECHAPPPPASQQPFQLRDILLPSSRGMLQLSTCFGAIGRVSEAEHFKLHGACAGH